MISKIKDSVNLLFIKILPHRFTIFFLLKEAMNNQNAKIKNRLRIR